MSDRAGNGAYRRSEVDQEPKRVMLATGARMKPTIPTAARGGTNHAALKRAR